MKRFPFDWLAWAVVAGFPGAGLPEDGGGTIRIGAERQLFVDDRIVDTSMSRGVFRTMNPPQDVRRVLRPERPWEELGFIFYCSVVEDEAGVKLYYGSYSWKEKLVRHFCLATSADGIHFERAALGKAEIDGKSWDTNRFPFSPIETSVFLDPHAPADKRYRMIYTGGGIDDPAKGGVYTATSPDGIRWNKHPERLLPFIPDSQHTAYWDEGLRKYVVYLRSWDRTRHHRQVCRVAVEEIDKPWPYDASVAPYFVWGPGKTPTLSGEFPVVMAPDASDPETLDIYTNTVTPYPFAPGQFVAFPAAYLKFKGPDWAGMALTSNDGSFTAQLATSPDGIAWTRWRQPYLAPGHFDGVDVKLVSLGKGMVRRGRWIYQYFVGWPYTHGQPGVWDRHPETVPDWTGKDEKGGIFLAKQRVDGFISLDSEYEGGVLLTKPLVFEGDRLTLNVDTRGTGVAKVAIVAETGEAIEGLGAADCEIIQGDDLDREVRWRSGAALSALAGKPVRVRVEMRGSKLFAFQFQRSQPLP